MDTFLRRLARGDSGQNLVEYAFIAVLIAFAVTVALGTLGSNLNSRFSQVAAHVGQGSGSTGDAASSPGATGGGSGGGGTTPPGRSGSSPGQGGGNPGRGR